MEHTMNIRSTVADWGAVLRTPLPLGLAALLAVQLIAALALGWGSGASLVPASADQPLLAFDPKSVQVVRIDGQGDTGSLAVVLTRGAQGWALKDLGDFPADGAKVDALLKKLADLKRPMPVATSKESLKRHKVADDGYERRVVLESGGKPVATLLLGESPGPRRQLARPAGDSAVYDLDLALYDVGNRTDDWLAKDKLQLDQETVAGIAAKDWEIVRGKDGWQFVPAAAGTGADSGKAPDAAAVINLLGRIGSLAYRGVLGTQDKPQYNQSAPVMELRLKLKNGDTRTYRISKPKEGQDYVLKASDRPWYFKLADFDLEGVIDQDKAKLRGEQPKPAAGTQPTPGAAGGEPTQGAVEAPPEAAEGAEASAAAGAPAPTAAPDPVPETAAPAPAAVPTAAPVETATPAPAPAPAPAQAQPAGATASPTPADAPAPTEPPAAAPADQAQQPK
jgi:hypothetical protein